MVGTWTYTTATNLLTVTGGTSGAPAGFIDAWNADKAGTYNIVATRNIVAADGAPVAVTNALKPADYVMLGKADLYLTVTNFILPSTVTLVGTDYLGNAVTEDIAITADGVYNTTKFYKTLTSTQVTVYGDSFTYKLDQGQWGVVWKQETNQYGFDAKLQIGDGSTATYFTDSNKEVAWLGSGSAGGSNWIDIKASATATFGILINTTNHITDSGIAFLFAFASNYAYINADTNAVCDLYSCSVSGIGCISRIKGNGIRRIWNFIGNRFRIGQITNANADFYNLYIAPPNAEYGLISPLTATMSTLNIRGTPSYLAYFAATATITDLKASGATTKSFDMGGSASMYLINPVLDAWTFNWAADATSKLYRQYTVDLKVTDKDGVAINAAAVTLKDKDGNVVFTVNTAADGTIATQTVSRGWYQKTSGDTLNEYSPHNLAITKAGYINYDQDFTLDEVTDWEIALHTQLTGDAVVGDVALGKTFYKDDAETQLTGTHTCPITVLTGDANPSDVFTGKTFYKDDATLKLTGTMLTRRGGSVVIKKEVKSELEEPLLMLTGVLLTEKLKQPKPSS